MAFWLRCFREACLSASYSICHRWSRHIDWDHLGPPDTSFWHRIEVKRLVKFLYFCWNLTELEMFCNLHHFAGNLSNLILFFLWLSLFQIASFFIPFCCYSEGLLVHCYDGYDHNFLYELGKSHPSLHYYHHFMHYFYWISLHHRCLKI